MDKGKVLDVLRKQVIDRIDVTKDSSDDDVWQIIDEELFRFSRDRNKGSPLGIQEKLIYGKEIFDSIRGLDVLEYLLKDDEITEIMINGPNNIFIEKNGEINQFNGKFTSEERLRDVIQQIVAGVNRRVNETSPIVDTRLKDGSRVNVVLSPVALNGPVVTIRKFGSHPLTMDRLIEIGAINQIAADFLKILVQSKYNLFICGGTGSGKTTFLNVLSNYIPVNERIITIEDSAELKINGIKNLVSLEVKQENSEGENGILIRDLIKTSLRMRPDRIIIGEVRGEEAFDLLSALNTGHDGSLSTGHANNSEDMLKRLETMVLMGIDMPLDGIKGQIASGIDIIIHLSRLRDKTRRVMEIVEVGDYESGEIKINPIFQFHEERKVNRQKDVFGELRWTGNKLNNVGKLLAAGFNEEDLEYGGE